MTHQYMEMKIKELEDRVKALEQESCGDAIIRQTVNPQEQIYCDRNICIRNEYSDIGCDECEVTKSQESITNRKKKLEDVLDKIRSEIAAIAMNGIVDEHTMFIRTGEQVRKMALDIIDKYKGESEDKR